MRNLRAESALGAAVAVALVLAGCSGQSGSKRTAVASFYPLAYAAERIAGPGWEVIDLTPPGTEAHDVELSLEDRAAIEEADLVVYLGDIGFQPQVEAAVDDARGSALALAPQVIHHPVGEELPPGIDPHVWLDPGVMRTMTSIIANAFIAEDREGQAGYRTRAEALKAELQVLYERYQQTLDISRCDYDVVVVPHEAFEHMVGRYAFRQFGLTGVTPEGEPTASRIAEAEQFLQDGQAGAVFYEPTEDESKRVAENLAKDSGVPALPLSTLESEPVEGDYITVMEDNLDSLREGLACA
jgi:zinc transport system substrate-binding protein